MGGARVGIALERIPEDLREVLERFLAARFEVWLVGGALRDMLLGVVPKDWDLATSASPEEVMSLFPRVVPIGLRHGTVQVHTRARSIEVTSCQAGGGHGTVADLRRRDFTVNALALSYPDGLLLDPFGGQEDLLRQTLRAVVDARARFREDPLRTLRAGRFVSVYGFRLEPPALAAMEEAAPGLRKVACERIREEFLKMLLGVHFDKGFEVLTQGRVVPEILPELVAMSESDEGGPHGGEGLAHLVQTVQFCPYRIPVRLAALFHHLAEEGRQKPLQDMAGMPGAAHGSARQAERILRRWRASQDLMSEVIGLLAHQVPEGSEAWRGGDLRRFLARVGREQLDDVLALAGADRRARRAPPHDLDALDHLRLRLAEELKRNVPLQRQDLAVSGRDIMQVLGVPPGPVVGQMLERLREQVLEDPVRNNPNFLLDFLRKKYNFKFQPSPTPGAKSRSKEDKHAG